jgi:hypothetical protein
MDSGKQIDYRKKPSPLLSKKGPVQDFGQKKTYVQSNGNRGFLQGENMG